MGLYINEIPSGDSETLPLPIRGKAEFLVQHTSAKAIFQPKEWQEDLVCVVENGPFDAAAYIDSPRELLAFSDPGDLRRKWWLLVPGARSLAR